jgi:hypothetical protein
MAVAFVAVGTSDAASNSAWTPGLPTRSVGDLLVCITGIRSITKSAQVTSGTWTERYNYVHTDSAGLSRIQVWTRTATNDASDAVTFGLSASETGCTNIGFMFSVSGANTTTPITAAQRAGNDSGAGTASNIGPIATLVAAATGAMMVSVGHKADDSNNGTPIVTPTNWNSIRQTASTSGNDALLGAYYRAATATTSYGGETWTVNATTTAVAWASAIFEINQAGGGTTYNSSPAGAITPAGATIKRANKPAAGSVTPAGALLRLVSKIVAGTLTPAGALAKRTAKNFAGALTPAGGLVGLQLVIYLQSVGGTLTPTGTLARKTLKVLAGTLTPAGTIAKRIAKRVAGAITATGALVTAIFDFDQADVTLADAAVTALTLADAAVTVLTLADASVTIVSLTDSTT